MSGGHRICPQFPCGFQQVLKLDFLVTTHTRNWRFAAQIAVGKIFDHCLEKMGFIVKNIVRDTKLIGDIPCVINVFTGTARPFTPDRHAMIVKLERDADDLIAFAQKKPRRDRAVHPARHGDDHTR